MTTFQYPENLGPAPQNPRSLNGLEPMRLVRSLMRVWGYGAAGANGVT